MQLTMIPIVLSTDHNYVMPTGITILSLLINSSDELYDFHILISSDVVESDCAKLEQQVKSVSPGSEIHFIHIEDAFDNSYEIRGISKACYYRLLIPWLLPQYDKVIYCDVDIIFKKGLNELYSVTLDDNYVGGVVTPGFVTNKHSAQYIKKLGLNPNKYINSGLLLINSSLQRKNQLKEQYLNLGSRNYFYQDQDIINIVCKDRIKYLPLSYNVPPKILFTSESPIKSTDSVVLHYAGDKPWKQFTYNWLDWWEVYNKSIFKEDDFNHKVSAHILNRKEWIKHTIKAFKNNVFHR